MGVLVGSQGKDGKVGEVGFLGRVLIFFIEPLYKPNLKKYCSIFLMIDMEDVYYKRCKYHENKHINEVLI